MTTNNFIYRETQIAYKIFGQGEAVVLLHGFGEDSSIWDNQIDFLEPLCKLIIPDLPGTGYSRLLKQQNVGLEDYADCIKALLDELEIESCILLGHSMGGYITLAFAEKYRDYIEAFGLVHSTAYADTEEKIATRKKGIKFIEEHGPHAFLKYSTPNLFSEEFKKQHEDVIRTLIDKGKNFSVEALIQYYKAMIERPDRTEVLKESEVPVLFIIGTEDVAAPMKDLMNQVHLPKQSHIHVIENVGHISTLEKPEELNEHLVAFIKNVF